MKKRIISVLCIFLFIGVMSILLVLNNKYVINIYDIDKVDTWQEAYCNCLDEYKADRYLADIGNVEVSEVTTRIMLKDLDTDTIPELLVVDVMLAPEVTEQISYDLDVFSFVDGKAEWVEIILPFEYRDYRTPRYVIVTAASSYLGDYFTGGEGSAMLVDEFEFIYE